MDGCHVVCQFVPQCHIFRKIRDGVLTLQDATHGHEGLLEPGAQQALTHGGAGLVEDPEQGAPFLPVPERLSEFQISAGREVQFHILGIGEDMDFPDILEIILLDTEQVVHDGAQCPDGIVRGEVQFLPGGIKVVGNEFFTVLQRERLVRQDLSHVLLLLFHVGGKTAETVALGVQEDFTRGESPKFVEGLVPALLLLQRCDLHLSGGHVDKSETGLPLPVVEAAEVVVAGLVQHVALNDGAGCDDADNVPLHKTLGKGRVFQLLADGHLIPLRHKPGDVRFDRMERHAAHRRTLLLPAVLAGEHQIQFPGSRLRVIEEHLIEVSDAEHEDGVPIVLLDIHILLHEWCKFRHDTLRFQGAKSFFRPPN